MVASHANVASLNLPPDLIALAYDRNDGQLVDTITNLTEPIFRRELEHELAERQAEAAEQEAEELAAYQRELDLWLLTSQVPGCTREGAERAYEQGREDVTSALPLARMGTLLADRETMVDFLMEQLPGSLREEACACYDEAEGDVVDGIVKLQRNTRHRLNQPLLSPRSKQRLRIRTVFMLALLYRERYGQLERGAEEALARVPLEGRSREGSLTGFVTPDGSRWTHTREEGWERRAPIEAASLGRAVRATEQLADVAEARGHAQTAHRARQTAADLRAQIDANDDAAPPSPQSPLPEPMLRRSDEQATLLHTPDGLERFSTRVVQAPHYGIRPLWRARESLSMRNYGPEDLERYHDWDPASMSSEDDNDDDPNDDNDHHHHHPIGSPTLAAESSSSAEEEEEDGEEEMPTAGTYARPRPFVRSVVRVHPQDARRDVAKHNLRIIQEQLDTEMANAAQGIVMSEGAYVAMMNAVKVLWESVNPQPVEVN